jgi:hypothetical protein
MGGRVLMQVHPNDDLWSAIRYNGTDGYEAEKIVDILAEVCGQNDELLWWWVVTLENEPGHYTFALLEGWCDYTGWDCQSYLKTHGIFETPQEAARAAPLLEDSSERAIRKNLLAQLEGRQPFALYVGGF